MESSIIDPMRPEIRNPEPDCAELRFEVRPSSRLGAEYAKGVWWGSCSDMALAV